jgi:hypothetical protein
MLRANLSHQARSRSSTVLSLEPLEGRLTPSNFYVRPSGNDHNDGRSPSTAWQTITKVNSQAYLLQPGDTINFEGGATYYGSLSFFHNNGTVNNPITVTSYNGRATINSGNTDGIDLADVSGFVVSNLNFVGTSSGRVAANGIGIGINGSSESHVYIDYVDVTGYGGQGITAYVGTNRTFQDLRITRATVHDEVRAPGAYAGGIAIWGSDPSQRAFSGLYIGDSFVYNVQGSFGIYLVNVADGVVERNVVHDIAYTDNNVGIMTYDSNQLVFQYNEIYSLVDWSGLDGDGFFIGNGVTNTVIQYNYTHDNTGAGYALAPNISGRAPVSGIILRYNISENDAQSFNSGIFVRDNVSNVDIYNNTVYLDAQGGSARADLTIWAWTGSGLHVRNNIFEAAPGVYNVLTSVYSRATDQDLVFQGNDYYVQGGTMRLYFPDATFTDLSAWQTATGQETLADGTPVGYMGDPQLVAPGQGGTIGNPDLLPTLNAYQLQSSSPLSPLGLDLAGLFGIDPGTQDFYGDPLSLLAGFAIGAHQPAAATGPVTRKLQGIVAEQSSTALATGADIGAIQIDASLLRVIAEDSTLAARKRDPGVAAAVGNTDLFALPIFSPL